MKSSAGKLLLCFLCAVCIGIIDVAGMRYLSARSLDLTEIPVAARDIPPRTSISEEDYVLVKVPGAYLMDNAYRSEAEILGKYTDIQGKIPAGSPFYDSMLYEMDSLPDLPALKLMDGESVFACTGESTSFSGLTAGMHVNIHLMINNSGSSIVAGMLVEHARVLTLKDHQGISISEQESTGLPYMIEVAVRKQDLDLLSLAEASGQLRFFASSDSYLDQEASLCEDSPAVQYLQQMRMKTELENITENS